MHCPKCGDGRIGHPKPARPYRGNALVRRRHCHHCGHRFNTIEFPMEEEQPGDPEIYMEYLKQ